MEIIASKKKIENEFRTLSAESGGSRTFLEGGVRYIAKEKQIPALRQCRGKKWTLQLKYTVFLATGQLMDTGIPVYVLKL